MPQAAGRGQCVSMGAMEANVAVTCSNKLTNPEGTGSSPAALSAAGASNNPEEIRRDLGKQHVSEGWWALPQTVPFLAADQALLLTQHTSSCPLIL